MSYHQPFGYKIGIYPRGDDQTHPYYTFNSFIETSQGINIFGCRLNLNTQVSQLDFRIEDGQKTLDRSAVTAGALITIQVGKNTNYFLDPNSYCLVGYIDFPSPDRPATGMNDVAVSVRSIKQGLYGTQVAFSRSSPLADINNPFSNKSKDFTLRQHIRKLIENKDFTLLEDISIKDRFGIDTSGISDKLDTVIPNLVYKDTDAGSMLDDLGGKLGFIWGFDFTGGGRKLFVDFPQTLRVPITIKNGPVLSTDDPNRTAYIDGSFGFPSSSFDNIHASRMFGVARVDNKKVVGSDIQIETTSTTNKAIYQPFFTDESRFTGLDIVMSKLGDPTSRKSILRGFVSTNKVLTGGVNAPDTLLQRWEINLDDIKSEPQAMHIELDDLKRRFITSTSFGFGWGVWQRSGTGTGDPNTDESNTIHVYRNNNSDGGSSIAPKGDFKDGFNQKWKKDGPTYAFSVNSDLSRLFSITNYTAAEKIGFIEPSPVDLSVIDDVNLAARYLTQLTYLTSLYRSEPRINCSLPDNFVFKPWQTVTLRDYLAQPSGVDFEIQDIVYDFSTNDSIVQLGGLVFLDDAWLTTWPCVQVL